MNVLFVIFIQIRMKIEVYVKDSVFTINCGTGAQKLRWLAEVGALKYDPNGMLKVGEPKFLKFQDGSMLNLNDRITDRLYDNARVWVGFEDYSPQQKKKDSKKGSKK